MNVKAADLLPLDSFGRFAVADPAALVPPMLLAPDGRYSCDGCDALIERAELVANAAGYYCADCANEGDS